MNRIEKTEETVRALYGQETSPLLAVRGADRRARGAALLKTVPEQAVRPKRRP